MASSRFLRLLKFLVPVSFILLASAYLLASSNDVLLTTPSWVPHPKLSLDTQHPLENVYEQGNSAERKAAFINEATAWEIDGAFNSTALHNLCASKSWTPGLHFKCATAYGGVGNVRNIVLTCVRYAIEAGATTLLVPEITARDADLIHLDTGTLLPFSYMFDLDIFRDYLTMACPQMRVVSHEFDLAQFPSLSNQTANLTAKHLGKDFKVERVMDFPAAWRTAFDKWLVFHGAPNGFSAESPLLVALTPAFFEFPIRYDPLDFIATFGRIVQFREQYRRLASVVLYALDNKYRLDIDPAAVGIPAKEKFYGAHLRTDADAIAASFASYDEQSTAYLKGAKQHKLPVVYLASGSQPDIIRFSNEAAKLKIDVTTKYALLESDPEFAADLEEMKSLTWDQQALIDFYVLLRSSHFGGTWASSFAFNIAFRRHVVVNGGTWKHAKAALNARSETASNSTAIAGRWSTDPDKLKKGECYKDAIDTIYGSPGMGIWFELSMWP